MLLRLHNIASSKTQTAGVTTRAVTRRSLQYAAGVARLTTHGGVRAGQGEPCLQMIETSALDLRLQTNSKGQEKDARKNLKNVPIPALDVKLHTTTPIVWVRHLHERAAPNPGSEPAIPVLVRSDSLQTTECGEYFPVLLIMNVKKDVIVGGLY